MKTHKTISSDSPSLRHLPTCASRSYRCVFRLWWPTCWKFSSLIRGTRIRTLRINVHQTGPSGFEKTQFKHLVEPIVREIRKLNHGLPPQGEQLLSRKHEGYGVQEGRLRGAIWPVPLLPLNSYFMIQLILNSCKYQILRIFQLLCGIFLFLLQIFSFFITSYGFFFISNIFS